MTPKQEREKYEWELKELGALGRKYSLTIKARNTLKESVSELFDGLGTAIAALVITVLDIPFFVAVFVWESLTNKPE